MATRIIVADDHPLFRDAITHLLERTVANLEADRKRGVQGKSVDLDGSRITKQHEPCQENSIISN